MKTLFLIAWRNLWRNKRRSIVVISSVALGIFAMIFSMGFMNGMNNQMVENTISTSLGHVSIFEKNFFEFMKLEYNFYPNKKILDIIGKNEHIKAFSPRLKVQCMIRSSEASRGVLISGIDPDKEKTVSNIYDYMLDDGYSRFIKSPEDDSIFISKTLAEKLDLLVGDRLVLMLQDKDKEIVGVGMTICGLFQTPIDTFDKYVVFTGIKSLQDIAGVGNNITELNMRVDNKKNVDSVKEFLIHEINEESLNVMSWKDMAPNLVSAVALFDKMMYVFFTIIFITVIFSITNTLIMAIMERFHEIGVMKSIGTRPSWIFAMILIEALNLGAVGLLGGTLAGVLLTGLLGLTGLDFSFYIESMRMWGTGSIIYPAIKTMDIIVAVFIVLVTTVIAALYPAVKAARIKPLDALHYI